MALLPSWHQGNKWYRKVNSKDRVEVLVTSMPIIKASSSPGTEHKEQTDPITIMTAF